MSTKTVLCSSCKGDKREDPKLPLELSPCRTCNGLGTVPAGSVAALGDDEPFEVVGVPGPGPLGVVKAPPEEDGGACNELGALRTRFRAAGRAGTPYHLQVNALTEAEADLVVDHVEVMSTAYDEGWTARIEAEWSVAWTTAPKHWDGHGTRGEVMGEWPGSPCPTCGGGPVLRRVRIDPHWRDYQRARYADGGFKIWSDDPRTKVDGTTVADTASDEPKGRGAKR